MTQAYFITGTDTGVGKTLVAAALLHAANARGWSTLGLKPVAAGGVLHEGRLMNDDARLLRDIASVRLAYGDVNPALVREAIAPHIAAERENLRLDVPEIASHCRQQLASAGADFAVVEGAGGWLVPLRGRASMADLVAAIDLPVILVVGLKLGCLNHALLTARAVTAAGLPLAAWAGSALEPDMPAQQENVATLEERLPAPCLGVVPHLGAGAQADAAARYLDLSRLPGVPA